MQYPLIPRVPRPRGLGGIANQMAGLGTWVVDRPWGLSPAIIPGPPQPYQNTIRTVLPRAQRPRLLNLHQGPVVPTGTWPQVRPTNAPVFRTPLIRAGERAVDEQLPFAGFGSGWVPLGVAHPPYFLVGTKDMKAGWSGFGAENGTGGTTVNVGGQQMRVSAQAQAQAEADPSLIYGIVTDSAIVYTDLLAQRDIFDTVYASGKRAYGAVMAEGLADQAARRDATQAAFGSTEALNAAATRINHYGAVVASLSGMAERGDLKNLPASVQRALNAMQRTSTVPDVMGSNTLLTQVTTPIDFGAITVLGVLLTLGVLAIIGATAAEVSTSGITNWLAERERTLAARAAADLARTRAQSAQWQVYDKQKAALMAKRAQVAPAEQRAIDAQMALLDQQYRAQDAHIKKAVNDAGGGGSIFLPLLMVAGGLLWATGGTRALKGLFTRKREKVAEKKQERGAFTFSVTPG